MKPSVSQPRYSADDACVRLLTEDHASAVGLFCSNNGELNDFLKKDALAYQNLHLGHTYLLMRKSDSKLLAYITLSMGALKLPENKHEFVFAGKRLGDYPKDFPNQFPALLIGKLATDRTEEGKSAASLLFEHALQTAYRQRQSIGCAFLMTHAYATPAVLGWYEKKRFQRVISHVDGRETLPLYLELGL